ncbi:MAG: NAD(P)-dependent oxidoreductase [Desulfosporosinus sp.]|nr:NAD(P)-dependent oxidoreductase [Desulfosporosinus sp.]
MKKVLLTGASGFVGKNILPLLREKFEVYSPSRQDLDLRNSEEVYNYLKIGKFDVVLHSANPNPIKNAKADQQNKMFEDSLRIFMNFQNATSLYRKLIYLGSGAEFDKRYEIASVSEDKLGRHLPEDDYGFAKYIMNSLARNSENIYNLRIFACYGPYDHESKFITHAINCCLKNEPVTIRQDCWFDYMHVFDVAKIASWFIVSEPMYHDYNCCSGKRILLSEIAAEVCRQMDNVRGVQFLSKELNREYTADNSRLLNEMRKMEFITLEKGIALQIEWHRRNMK